MSAIAQTRSQARTARLIAQVQEKEEDKEDGEEEEEDKSDSHETSNDTLNGAISLQTELMDARENLNLEDTVLTQEFDKLLKSSCINLLHQSYSSLYQKVIPSAVYNEIVDTCAAHKADFENQCDQETTKIINNIFNDIKEFQTDENIYKLIEHLDTRKCNVKDKTSIEYTVLSIVNEVAKSFKLYTNEAKLSEATYLRKFSQILDDLLFSTTLVEIRDGETVSNATRRMLITQGEEVDYGRRIDLVVKTKDGDAQYELAANEFKKSDVSYDVLKYQQSKNIRINACIKNEIDLLLNNHDTPINYFDFKGRKAYVSQLFSFQGCLVAFKVGLFAIPKTLVQLDGFRSSLVALYAWKNSTLKNSQSILIALSNEEATYNLVDIADDLPPALSIPAPKTPGTSCQGFFITIKTFKAKMI